MKAKDVNRIAKETLQILLYRCIDVEEVREFAADVALDEGIELTDLEAVKTRVNELLNELRNKLMEDF